MFELVLFWLLGLGAVGTASMVVIPPVSRNPVYAAIALVICFFFLAGIYMLLLAHLMAVLQILVYAGAIMVLFLFIIMLLDLKTAARPRRINPLLALSGAIIPLAFIVQLGAILPEVDSGDFEPLALKEAADEFYDPNRESDEQSEIYRSLRNDSLPDVHLIGLTMFGHEGDNPTIKTPGYNFPLQIIGVLLLVATVGVVALSLKKKDPLPDNSEP